MAVIVDNDFPGISLAAARVNAGLSQKEFGKACNVSESTVISWEKGKTLPSVKKLAVIERVTGMPLNYIDFDRH